MALTAAPAAAASDAPPATVARGKYLAVASDCAACHTKPNGKTFAGGLAVESPVGKIYASNITPSTNFGIGRYSEAQFERAIRRGVRRDGANLYPAMPYTSFATFTNDDVHALYSYFMQAVAPVDEAARNTDLPFPMNIRPSMKIWNLLFLKGKPFEADAAQSPEWNRGKYLVGSAAHCAECHTPRGFLMELEAGKQFAGGPVDAWYAPNITSDPVSGIGSWSQGDLVHFLRSGSLHAKAWAAGSMGEAVALSFQHLDEADLGAIATYVRSVPPIRNPADTTSRFDTGKAFSVVDLQRGAEKVGFETASPGAAELFQGNCASCHGAGGQGSGQGYFPSLFNNSAVGADRPNNLIATLLNGVHRTTAEKGDAYMPAFGELLSDSQIALVGNYVLTNFGNGQVTISADQVEKIRKGGGSSDLLLWARIGVAVGGVVVLLLIFFIIRHFTRSRAARPHAVA